MKFKYIIIAAGLGILGFLFYPRKEAKPLSDFYFIKPVRILEKEAPYYTGIHQSEPLVKTFDLGYVYKFNQAIIAFEDPINKGPRRYDILVSYSRKKGYNRALEYAAKSSEYTYPIQRFPVPVEGRWVQIVVNDWYSNKPKLKANEFQVGIQYENPSPVRSISSEYNQKTLHKLTDLIISEDSKWTAAKRITKKIKEEKETETKFTFNPPEDDIIVTFDLENIIAIYGTRLTTDGPGNNLKRYEISVSIDGDKYTTVYVSPELEDKTVADHFATTNPPRSPLQGGKLQARYVRLKISKGDWYGDYPEIRELEFFTDDYKLPPELPHDINEYNAWQVNYDDCGRENRLSPNLVQGFSFDRGTDDENRYFYPEEELEPGNTLSQRSFCYHYDTIVFRYTNLVSDALYWVQVTYLQSKDGNRVQNLDVDGYILHGSELEIPKGRAKIYTFSIPKDAYADGEFELHFRRLAGINAVVSEVGLFEARPQAEQIAATSTLSRAVQVSTPVTIDGSLEEWPTIYPLIPLKFQEHIEQTVSLPIKVYLQWEQQNLYLGAEIDRTVMTESRKQIAELLGNLHIFVDTTTSRSPGIYRTTDHHLLFYRIGSRDHRVHPKIAQIHHHLDAIPANIPDRKEIEYAQAFTETGYTLEARIPGNEVLQEFNPQIGKTIGFNYILSNSAIDNMGWAAEKIDAPPNQWGTVELVSQISGKIMVMDEAGKKPIDSFDANDRVIVAVWDTDRNIDRSKIETVDVEIGGTITNDKEKLTLTESDPMDYQNIPNSDLFAFKLPTLYATEPIEGDKILQVVGNETVTLTYTDPYFAPGQRNKELQVDLKVNVGTDGEIFIMKESGERVNQFRAGDTLIFGVRDPDLEVGQTVSLPDGQEEYRDSSPDTRHSTLTIELKVEESDEVEKVLLQSATDLSFSGSIKTEYAAVPTRRQEDKSSIYNELTTPNDGVLQVAGTQILIAIYIDEIQETGQTDVQVTAKAKVEVGDTGILSIDLATREPSSPLVGGIRGVPGSIVKFNAGTALQLRLKDIDLNKDNSKKDTVEITSNGNMLDDKVKIVLQETGNTTGEFVGDCKTTYATEANPENDLLEIKGNEEVTFTYIDALQGTGATNIPVEVLAKVNVGEDGTLTIVRSISLTNVEKFNAGDILYFRLQDADEKSSKIEITVVGNQTNDKENVELYQTSSTSAVFIGSIKTEYVDQTVAEVARFRTSRILANSATIGSVDDGILQVQGNEKVIAIYIDKLRRTGETNISVSDSATVNTGYTGRLAVYKKEDVGQTVSLPINTIRREEDKSSIYNEFTTGKSIDRFKAGETIILEIEDLDLSRTSAVAELLETDSSEDMVRDNIRVSMREVSGNAGIFRGEIKTEYGQKAIPNDSILQVQGLGVVTFTYVDALQETGKTQVPISVQLVVETGEKGNLELYAADGKTPVAGSEIGIGSFSAGDMLNLKLSDNDLNIDQNSKDLVKVTVVGDRLEDELLLWLIETENDSGIFQGKLLTEYSDSYDITDGILQVTDKEVVSVKYLDQIIATGETNVLIEAKAIVRSSNPGILLIIDEMDEELGNFNAGRTIHFLLEDLLLSTVDPTVEASITVNGDKTNDRVTVTLDKVFGEEGLFRGTVATRYGTTPIYDKTLDVQGGEKITATYRPNFPGVYELTVQDTTYVNKGNRGQILIVKNDGTQVYNFNAGATLYFRVEDPDLNKNPFDIDFADIWVSAEGERGTVESSSNAVSSSNYVFLREEGKNSGIFVGSLKTEHGRSLQSSMFSSQYKNKRTPSGDENKTDVLGLVGGEIVKAVYIDELIDTGETNVEITDTCRANSIGSATYAEEKVAIDGIADKWPLETVLKTEQDEALMWVQWDRDNLYILAQVYDDEVIVTDATKWYEGGTDAIELHIDLNPDEAEKPDYLSKTNEEKEFVFWLCPKGGGFGGIRPYAGQYEPDYKPNYTPLKLSVKYRSGFYILEAAIPFSPALKGFDPMKTTRIDKIGFNYVIYRSDAPIVQWAKQAEGASSVQLSKLGTLYLERP